MNQEFAFSSVQFVSVLDKIPQAHSELKKALVEKYNTLSTTDKKEFTKDLIAMINGLNVNSNIKGFDFDKYKPEPRYLLPSTGKSYTMEQLYELWFQGKTKVVKLIKDLEVCIREESIPKDKSPLTYVLIEEIENLHPFILSIPFDVSEKAVDYPAGIEELDLPFKFCSFERSEITRSLFDISRMTKEGIIEKLRVEVIAVYEESPRHYVFGMLYTLDANDKQLHFEVLRERENNKNLSLTSPLKRILSLLTQSKLGKMNSSKERIRIGSGKERKSFFIKDIVVVAPKRNFEESTKNIGREIDWTHRYEVSGHWRKVANIGKDRDGKYIIPGRTWVIPSVRGPEHLPLIKKSRVFKENENEPL